MRSSAIRNVIFDFGGVLVHWKPQEIIDGFYADESLRRAVRQAVFQHPDWIEMDRGTLAEDIAVQRCSERMGRPVAEMAELLEHARNSLTPIWESVAILRDLARRGIPCYGLSNMPAATFAHLRHRYDFWGLLRGIVISGQIGLIKPDAEIFHHLAREHGLAYAESVFIDDHPPNVAAARQVGLQALLFTSPAQCAVDLERLLGAQ